MANERYFVMGQAYISVDGGDTALITEAPVRLATGVATTYHCTQVGTFHIYMANGTTGTVASDTATVASSPVTLSAGSNTITISSIAGGEHFTVDLAIGTAANTNSVNSWSAASGGACGASVPVATTNSAYFNANSFTAASQVLTVDANFACHDMVWTGATNTPTLTGTNKTVTMSGTVPTFIVAMTISGSITFILTGADATAKTWTTGGRTFYGITLTGAGDYVVSTGSDAWTYVQVLTIDRSVASKTLTITSAKNLCVATLVCAVSSTRTFTINASAASVANLYHYGGTPIYLDYIVVNYIAAYYSVSWYYVAANSTVTNSTGWTAGAPPAALGSVATIAYSDVIADISTGDATVLSGGYVYVLSRGSQNMAKIDINHIGTDMDVVIDKTYAGGSQPYGDYMIMGTDGYLWTSCSATGFICKVNPSDLSLVASYEIFSAPAEPVYSITDDETYVYVSSDADIATHAYFAKMLKAAPNTVTVAELTVPTMTEASQFHAMINDVLYCYVGLAGAGGVSLALKIKKSDLSLETSVNIGATGTHDDSAIDTSYVYFARAVIIKLALSDLTETDITMTGMTKEIDGFCLLPNGTILANDVVYYGDGTGRVLVTDSSQTPLGYYLITGLLDTNVKEKWNPNDIIVNGKYVYILMYENSTHGVRLYKFNLSDFGINLTSQTCGNTIANLLATAKGSIVHF